MKQTKNVNMIVPVVENTQQGPLKPGKVDLRAEETAAQELLESGIKFDFTVNADGVTNDGGMYTGHGYISSDGIDIDTGVAFYIKNRNARTCFSDYLKQAKETLKEEAVFDEKKTKVGQRLIGISDEQNYFVALLSGNLCRKYSSTSLRHLLAFEIWRDL